MTYLLFAGWAYGSVGGIHDLINTFETLEEAQVAGSQECATSWHDRWAHIAIIEDGMLRLVSETTDDGQGWRELQARNWRC